MPPLDPGWVALIATIMGGVGLKIVEHWLSRNKVRIDDAALIRNELRAEITAQREEIKQLEEAVEHWRHEYYGLRDKYMALQTELTLAMQSIKEEALEAEEVAKELRSQPPATP